MYIYIVELFSKHFRRDWSERFARARAYSKWRLISFLRGRGNVTREPTRN